MEFKIDMDFYNRVKNKFHSVEKGTTVFISLYSENVDELVSIIFTEKEIAQYFVLLREHLNNDKAYVVLDRDDDISLFFLRCRDFAVEEDLNTGKIIQFRRNPFIDLNLNDEMVRNDLVKLGKLLAGDSEAS